LWQAQYFVTDNRVVNDLPRWAITRTAKLATLPVGLAGRTALGLGKRLGGRPAERVATEIQHRTADQIFRVLGELKGGAMKFGQALSIFEAALPPEIAGPYRATLTKLQESAPPLPASTVHRVLAEDLGPDWREAFAEFNDKPAAAASIGQVHRARWRDGREVAVKIQYPGAGRALLSDFNQLSRVARLFAVLMPGLEVRPLLDELRSRVAEELDYHLEAEAQHAFAVAYTGDPDIVVPDVVAGTSHVLITEWMDGTPLSKIITDGSQEERDRAGMLFVRFLFSGPARAGLLHADPHPGNFRLLADGRLGVLDFGAVDRLPDGLPPFMGRLLRIVHDGGDLGPAERELREQGFIREGIDFDPEALRVFLAPLAEPSRVERFTFSREWLRGEATRVTDPRAANMTRRLNLPPSYVLIHRVSTAGMGVLCQLESEGPFRAEMLRWMPGYADASPQAEAPTADAASPAPVSPDLVTADPVGPDLVALNPVGPDPVNPATVGPDPVRPVTLSPATAEPNGAGPATAEPNGAGPAADELNGESPALGELKGESPAPDELNGASAATGTMNGASAAPAGLNGPGPAPGWLNGESPAPAEPDGEGGAPGEPDAVSPAL
jgi:predicted unusual protein kinase regulating ubiquinone biosynthesis (AarF/ABC1/UbiB family)